MILTRNARIALAQVLLAGLAGIAAFQCWTISHQIARLEEAADLDAAIQELKAHTEGAKGSK